MPTPQPIEVARRLRQLIDGFSPDYKWFTSNAPIGFTAADIRVLCDAVEATDATADDLHQARETVRALLAAENKTIHCAFCGQAYPDGTPESKHERLAAHIRECSQHPLKPLIEAARFALTHSHGALGEDAYAEISWEALDRLEKAVTVGGNK